MHSIVDTSNEKPRLVNLIAINFASMAEPIYEYLEQIKNHEGTMSQLPVVDIDDWLDIYRRPSRLKKLTKSILVNFNKAEQMAKSVHTLFVEGMKDMGLTDEQIEEWKKEFNKGGFGVIDDNDESKEQYLCSPKEVDVELENKSVSKPLQWEK